MTTHFISTLDRAQFSPPPPIDLGAIDLGGSAVRRVVRENIAKAAPSSSPRECPPQEAKPAPQRFSIRQRLAFVFAIIAVPAFAAPGDFGALPGDAPAESVSADVSTAARSALAFEKPGMSFPGSAFYYLADPPAQALVALPETDPLQLGAQGGREIGELIDAGPAARAFTATGSGLARAQDCLAQAIWYEAASESEAGQRAVAQVVLNRVAHPAWPSSVCGVVYQGAERSTGCQFSFTCDGSLSRKAGGSTWRRAQQIAAEALSGSVYAPIGHATHYHTLWVDPYWADSLTHVGTIGAHRFYRNRGAAGEKAAFNDRYSGSEPAGAIAAAMAAASRNAGASAGMGTDRGAGLGAGSGAGPGAGQAARITALPVIDTMASPAPHATGRSAGAHDAASAATLADPALGNAGQAREEFAKAGRWKVNPATLDLATKGAGTKSPAD